MSSAELFADLRDAYACGFILLRLGFSENVIESFCSELEQLPEETRAKVVEGLMLATTMFRVTLKPIKTWIVEQLSDGRQLSKDDLLPGLKERFGVGRMTLDKAVVELKEEDLIYFVPKGIDPKTGRKVPGSKWLIARKDPE